MGSVLVGTGTSNPEKFQDYPQFTLLLVHDPFSIKGVVCHYKIQDSQIYFQILVKFHILHDD